MAGTESDEDTADGPSGSIWRELYVGGIGALIGAAGLFGVAIWTGSVEDDRATCGYAVELVTDDDLNASLDPFHQQRLLGEAQRKVLECLND